MVRPTRLVILTAVCALAAGGVWAAASNSGVGADDLEKLHHEADLNAKLEKIGENNARLGASNQSILGNLSTIYDKTSTTADIHDKLRTVGTGLNGQNSTLTDIERVTGQQVTLSTDMNNLSQFLKGKMDAINGSTETQISQVARLRSITLDTRQKMNTVVDQNRKLEVKLGAAAVKSRKAERSLP